MQYRRRWGLIWWRAVLIAKRVEGAWFWQSCRRRCTKSGVEYRGNEIVQGATYPNIEAVKDAVRLWVISLKQEFRVVKSDSKEYEVKCGNDRCPWRVHAFKEKWKSNWKCSIVTDHTCLLSEVQLSHRNISSDFVAKQIYELIMDNLNYEPKMIVRHIERTYQYTISYLKAWRT